MSLSTYADLKTAVGNWLHRGDLTSYLDDLVTVGEAWIYRNVRARQMEASLAGQLTVASGIAPLPTDWIAPKIVIYSGSPDRLLRPMPAAGIYERYTTRTGGTPNFYAIDGANMIFGPGISDGATITGTYYQNLGAVSASAHALFTSNPDLYLFASLAEAAPFLKADARVQMWMAKRDAITNDINQYAQRARFGDSMAVA